MVLYGEPVEQEMATSQDPVVSQVWHEKEVAEYDPFPYKRVYKYYVLTSCLNSYTFLLQLKSVYEGKSSMLDWGQVRQSPMIVLQGEYAKLLFRR